jgi:hypothetical protein
LGFTTVQLVGLVATSRRESRTNDSTVVGRSSSPAKLLAKFQPVTIYHPGEAASATPPSDIAASATAAIVMHIRLNLIVTPFAS